MAFPASAMQIDKGYQISQGVHFVYAAVDEVNYFVADEVSHVSIWSGRGINPVKSAKSDQPPGPLYALSLKTDGQSLTGYHRRC